MSTADVLLCPACRAQSMPLQAGGDVRCPACDVSYPSVAGVRLLVDDAPSFRRALGAQQQALREASNDQVERLSAEARKPALLSRTKRRLEAVVEAHRRRADEIERLLAPFATTHGHAPQRHAAVSGINNLQILFRDWAWEATSENREALGLVMSVARAPLGRVLVLGSGGGRLAYDLHRCAGPCETLAVDIDPLYCAVAAAVTSGQEVTLTDVSHPTKSWSLRAAARVDDFHVLLADGLFPPVADLSIDTVITPWFLDQVVVDLRESVGEIRRVLKPGGRWISFGPTVYPATRPPALRLMPDEARDLMELAGFEIEAEEHATLSYLRSPLNDYGRIEPCWARSARKGELDVMRRCGDGPAAFLVFPFAVVPAWPDKATFHHERGVVRAIVELVDGKRTIADISAELASRSGMSAAELVDPVRHCLEEHHPAARR